MSKVYKYRELIKILKRYDSLFQTHIHRGKGSEQIIYHPNIKGQSRSFPIKCHGENTEIRKGVLSALIRRFELPKELFR